MVQSFIFFLVFITKRSIEPTLKWILVALTFCCGIILTKEFLTVTYGYLQFPHLIYAEAPFIYALSPLLLLYLQAQIKGQTWKRIYLLHFIPVALVFLGNLNFYFFPADLKVQYQDGYTQGNYTAPIHHINFILFFLQGLIYTLLSWRLIQSTPPGQKVYLFQKILVAGLFVFSILGLLLIFGANAGNQELIYLNGDLFILWLAMFLIALFIQGMQFPKQLFFIPTKREASLDQGQLVEVMDRVHTFMQREAPFRKADYDIHQMATALGYSKSFLQKTIRQQQDLSFRDFLNEYRIEAAKKKLADPQSQHYTIQAISEEVGFGSLATFYRLFKKHEGITPKTFIEIHKNNP